MAQQATWDAWAVQALTTSGSFKAADHAGVYGLDGTCWGATDDTARTLPKEFFQCANSIMSGGASAGKLSVCDKKYITLRSDSGLILAKCGTGGVTVCKGNQSFAVGIYDDDSVQPNNNCLAVSTLCDNLKEQGF